MLAVFPGRVVPLDGLSFWQGYRLGSTIIPAWLEFPSVIPDWIVPLAGLCVLAEPQAGLHT